MPNDYTLDVGKTGQGSPGGQESGKSTYETASLWSELATLLYPETLRLCQTIVRLGEIPLGLTDGTLRPEMRAEVLAMIRKEIESGSLNSKLLAQAVENSSLRLA